MAQLAQPGYGAPILPLDAVVAIGGFGPRTRGLALEAIALGGSLLGDALNDDRRRISLWSFEMTIKDRTTNGQLAYTRRY